MTQKSILSKILILTFICGVFTQQIIDNTRVIINVENLTTYSRWRVANQKIFFNDDQKLYRQAVFLDNLSKINEHNADPNSTYQMALTPFSDMTEEEFAQQILNEELTSPSQAQQETERITLKNLEISQKITNPFENISNFMKPINEIDDEEAPAALAAPSGGVSLLSSVDWRTKGAVTGVKNQGQCGSCWAFSASGLMESFNYIRNKSLKTFSEQQLVDCVTTANGYDSYGCKGGWPSEALRYSSKYGILQASQYAAYVGVQGKCKVTAPTSGFKPLFYYKIANSVNNLKTGLNYEPISVLVDASKWGLYGSGVFNGCSSSVKINHAVLAVGYDSAGNWILKNSWGTIWGEKGYMRLKAGNNCGILTSNYFILV